MDRGTQHSVLETGRRQRYSLAAYLLSVSSPLIPKSSSSICPHSTLSPSPHTNTFTMRLILLVTALFAAIAYTAPTDNAVAKLTERACPAHCAIFCPDCCESIHCPDVSRPLPSLPGIIVGIRELC